MTDLRLGLGLAAAVAAVLVFAILIPYLLSAQRNRMHGGRGFVQRSRLTCPRCLGVFDYNWVPGWGLNAVRLGK